MTETKEFFDKIAKAFERIAEAIEDIAETCHELPNIIDSAPAKTTSASKPEETKDEEPKKRKRRSKAEIEADKAIKEAVAEPATEEQTSEDDDTGLFDAPKKKASGTKKEPEAEKKEGALDKNVVRTKLLKMTNENGFSHEQVQEIMKEVTGEISLKTMDPGKYEDLMIRLNKEIKKAA